MNKIIFILFLLFLSITQLSAAPLTPHSTLARINILDSITLNATQPLFFGSVPWGMTVDARTIAINTCATPPNPAIFATTGGNIGFIDLTGSLPNQNGSLLITFPTVLDKGVGPTIPVTLDAMFCALTGSIPVHLTDGVTSNVLFQIDTVNPTLSNIIYVGGITVIPGVAPGTYVGTVNLVVTY